MRASRANLIGILVIVTVTVLVLKLFNSGEAMSQKQEEKPPAYETTEIVFDR